MKKYKSKIGKGLVVFLSIVFIGFAVKMTMDFSWTALAIVLPLVIFIVHMFWTTYCIIDNGILKIKCGMLYNHKIEIESILKMIETNTIISSPALSLDRLEIVYNKYDRIIISPKNKQEFINNLLEINPNIEIIYKKKGR